jgi:hypothetical protein
MKNNYKELCEITKAARERNPENNKPEPKELSVRQEKKLLEDVRSDLVLAVFKLGDSRFTKLMKMIDDAAMESDREAIAADDSLNERC